jgi:hypothetical protein
VFFGLGQYGHQICFDGYDVAAYDPNSIGFPLPSSGILKNLLVSAAALSQNNPPGIQVQFQVWVNSAPTNIGCVFTLLINQQATCSDATDTAPVNTGDLVAMQMTASASPPGLTMGPMVVSFEKQ